MSSQAQFEQWQLTIMQHLPHLSKPQAYGLALWSWGMVLARSCALTAVSGLLAAVWRRKENTLRQRCARMVLRGRGQTRSAAADAGSGVLFCPAVALGHHGVAGHPDRLGPRRQLVGHALCRVGPQCGLSRLRDSGSLDCVARGQAPGLAPRVAAAATPTASGDSQRLDRHRAGRPRVVRPLALSAHCAPGVASVFAHQPPAARFGPRARGVRSPSRPWCLSPAPRGPAGVPLFRVHRVAWRAPCWRAGTRATRTRG